MGLKRGTQRGSVFRFGGIRGDPRWAGGAPTRYRGAGNLFPIWLQLFKETTHRLRTLTIRPWLEWRWGGHRVHWPHMRYDGPLRALSELMLMSAKEPC